MVNFNTYSNTYSYNRHISENDFSNKKRSRCEFDDSSALKAQNLMKKLTDISGQSEDSMQQPLRKKIKLSTPSFNCTHLENFNTFFDVINDEDTLPPLDPLPPSQTGEFDRSSSLPAQDPIISLSPGAIENLPFSRLVHTFHRCYRDNDLLNFPSIIEAELNLNFFQIIQRASAKGSNYLERSLATLDFCLTFFNNHLALNPFDADALTIRGELLRQRSYLNYDEVNLKKAAADLTLAIKLNPTNSTSLAIRGEIYRKTGQLERALQDLKDAIALNQADAFAFTVRGRILNEQKFENDSLKDLDRALELTPTSSLALSYRSNLLYKRPKHFDSALEDLRSALHLCPYNIFALITVARIFREQKQFAKALEELNKAIDLNPSHVQARLFRGEILGQKGLCREALVDLEAVLAINPNQKTALNLHRKCRIAIEASSRLNKASSA